MSLIALTGYARTGKDTVGKILVDHYGFTRAAFGDVLKAVAEDINPTIYWDSTDLDPVRHSATVRQILDCCGGWEQAKDEIPAIRQHLVDLGNSLRRHIEGIEVFAALASVPGDAPHVVLTNVYHPEEIEQIRARGGVALRVIRPGYGPANADEASAAKSPVDATVVNDGSVDKLRVNLDLVLRYLNRGPYEETA